MRRAGSHLHHLLRLGLIEVAQLTRRSRRLVSAVPQSPILALAPRVHHAVIAQCNRVLIAARNLQDAASAANSLRRPAVEDAWGGDVADIALAARAALGRGCIRGCCREVLIAKP